MKLSNEQIQAILDDVQPSIVEGIKREIGGDIQRIIINEASEQIREAVSAWVKENIIPEIEVSLVESKKSLISLGVAMGQKMVEEVSRAATESLKKKLESNWERKKIFEALFT